MITSTWTGPVPELRRVEADRKPTLKPGERVRFTEAYHRATGDYAEWGQTWTIQACACTLCRSAAFVAVDEASAIWEGLRHMQAVNLQLADALELIAAE